MKKEFCDTLLCLFPYCIHITCHSHIASLVASDLKKGFKEATEFVKCFCNLFFVPSGRKSRFMKFLQNVKKPEDSVTMPPNPTTKSWSAWFDSVLYHVEHYFFFPDFIQEELDRGRAVASNSLLRLEEMYQEPSFMKMLHAQLAFLKMKAPTLMAYLNYFQQRMPHVTQAHRKMERLLDYLHANTNLEQEDLQFCFEGEYDFTCEEKKELVCLFSSAFTAAHAKLCKYVVDGAQPASKFLDQVPVLDPRNLIDVDHDFNSIDSIPGFEAVAKVEWELYVNSLGPLAVKHSKDGHLDLTWFWKSKASTLPELYKLASYYTTTTIGSYDVERSFSAYNEILDEKQRSLKESTIKAFHFLNWNLRIKSSIKQEEEKQSNPQNSLNVTKETLKDTQGKKQPVSVEVSDFPRLFNAAKERRQQPQPAPACEDTSANTVKESKRKNIDVADSEGTKVVPKKKKTSAEHGKSFRATLPQFFSAKPDAESRK